MSKREYHIYYRNLHDQLIHIQIEGKNSTVKRINDLFDRKKQDFDSFRRRLVIIDENFVHHTPKQVTKIQLA